MVFVPPTWLQYWKPWTIEMEATLAGLLSNKPLVLAAGGGVLSPIKDPVA